MKFLFRAFSAGFLLIITLSFLSFSGIKLKSALEKRDEKSFSARYAKERIYSANVQELKSTNIKPKIIAYGEAKSWRSLEIRATNSGQLIFLSESFREGGQVKTGDLLFKIDPREAEDNFSVAEVNLLDARAEYNEAKATLALLESDLSDAKSQLELRFRALKRQKSLNDSGIVTNAAVENAELLFSNANQTVSGKINAVARGKAQIERMEIGVKRAAINLEQAKRRVAENYYWAPFDGVITKVLVTPGRLLNKNEQLGTLIDPTSMEVEFQLSNLEFSRITNEDGDVLPLSVRVKKGELTNQFVQTGKIQRAGVEAIPGTSGRQLFASLNPKKGSFVQVGDFLIVEIEEKRLENVAVISAAAIDSQGKILLLGEEDRLEEVEVTVLRWQSNDAIVANAPFGREYVVRRSPQLDAGLRVRPLRVMESTEATKTNARKSFQEEDIALDDAERQKLINFVEENDRLPTKVKESILKKLKLKKVPRKLVNRLNTQMETN